MGPESTIEIPLLDVKEHSIPFVTYQKKIKSIQSHLLASSMKLFLAHVSIILCCVQSLIFQLLYLRFVWLVFLVWSVFLFWHILHSSDNFNYAGYLTWFLCVFLILILPNFTHWQKKKFVLQMVCFSTFSRCLLREEEWA